MKKLKKIFIDFVKRKGYDKQNQNNMEQSSAYEIPDE